MVSVPAGFPSEPEDQPSRLLPGILHALRRRWLLIAFLGFLLGSGAAIGVYYTAKDSYTARAVLRIPVHREAIAFDPVAMDTGSFEVFVNTQRQLVTNDGVLLEALAHEGVAGLPAVLEQTDSLDWIRSLISTSFSSDSEVMTVSLTYEDPNTAKLLLDAVLEAYLKSAADWENGRMNSRLERLRSREDDAEVELGRLMGLLQDELKSEAEPSDLVAKREHLQDAEVESLQVNFELRLLEPLVSQSEVATDQEQPDVVPAEGEVRGDVEPYSNEDEPDQANSDLSRAAEITAEELDALVDADPVTDELETQIKAEEARIRSARARATPDAPWLPEYVENREARIAEVRIQIAERREDLRTEWNRRAALMGTSGNSQISQAERYDQLKRRAAALENEKLRLRAAINNSQYGATVQSELLAADVDVQKALLQSIRDQIGQMETERLTPDDDEAESQNDERFADRITLLGSYDPTKSDRKPRVIKAGAAGGAVFLLLGAGIVLLDMRRRRVSSPDDVANDLQLNVIGTLPLLKRSRRRNQRLSRQLAEAVDSIAAALICGRTALGTQAVMITSAVAGEGKTTLAANLATSLASAGRRTLLIDFDLRRPMLHSVYDLERGPGVCEALIGEIEVSGACHETEDPSLWVMPAGHWRERAISQLADQRLQQLFSELRTQYDFIVVDASPVLPIVDARLVGKHVDGTILSLLRDVSEVPKVAATCRALESFDVRVLGGVMIGSTDEVYYGYPPTHGQLPESA